MIEKIFYKKDKLSSNIKKIDLKSHYVIPGFIDSHTHLVSKGIELQRINLEKCTSLSKCLSKLRSELNKDNEVLFGSNWDESRWIKDETYKLNKNLLNKISTRKPIIMRRICGHVAVVNTKALNLIPKQWKIVDRHNGYLYKDIALHLDEVFKPSEKMLEKAVSLATAQALARGITSIHEIAYPLYYFKILQEAHKNGKLKLRVATYILHKHLDKIISLGLLSGFGDDFLKFAGIKIFTDGSVGAKTAAIVKPYRHTKQRGILFMAMRKFDTIVRLAEDNGIQLMIHSIGDRATCKVLKVFEKNIDRRNPLRHRLEHIEILDEDLIGRIASMNLIASMQPNFVKRWQMPGGMYEQYLGNRYMGANCFKKLLKAGVRVVFGSDCMPLGPFYGIQGAVNHPSSSAKLNSYESLKLYTKEPAYATFDENKKGTIEQDKFADLVVLDKNPLEANNLNRIKVLKTFINGECVYSK